MQLLFIILTILFANGNALDSPRVETNTGTIIGTTKEVNVFGETKVVENYLGIPYAEPPVGDLRFSKAVPKGNLAAPLNATQHGKACYQMEIFPTWKMINRSEDCLFLNVYVPANQPDKLAVMVYFHGGALVHGASNSFISDTLSLFGNVVVVTFNYRLSIFGFLTTEDRFARGNYAYSDQHLAIKWVHENIQSFNGDPKRITLFGQSAGGNSISIQSVYEGNIGMFKRAILQSGAGIPRPYDVAFAEPKKDAQKLGEFVGCKDTQSSKLLIECLREVPAAELYQTLNSFTNGFFSSWPLPFISNTNDGTFMKSKSRDVIGSANSDGHDLFSSIDLMVGITSNEGCYMSPVAGVQDTENFNPNRTFYENTLVPIAMGLAFGKNPTKLISDLMLQVYTNWNDPKNTTLIRENFVNMYTDTIFAETSMDFATQHLKLARNNSTTFLYEFDVLNATKLLNSPSWCIRGTHADELYFLFFEEAGGLSTFILPDYQPTAWERDFAKMIMTKWTNFAKTG